MVRENEFEKNLQDFYTEKRPTHIEKRQDCPTPLELSDYLERRSSLSHSPLGPSRRRLAEADEAEGQALVMEHISNCQCCLSLIELAQRAKKEQSVFPAPPAQMVTRAKKLALPVSFKRWSQYKWLVLALLPFTLSFVFPRYFLQFLIATVILGLKWVFDTATSRTLIMVYDAWRKKDQDSVQKGRDILPNSRTKRFS